MAHFKMKFLHTALSIALSGLILTALPLTAASTTLDASADILETALLPPTLTAQDIAFKEAWKSVQRGKSLSLDTPTSDTLKDYPLFDYLVWGTLNNQLKKDPQNQDIQQNALDFIAHHQGQYLGERAITDFLYAVSKYLSPKTFNALFDQLAWNQSDAALQVTHVVLNPQKFDTQEKFTLYRDTRYRGEFLPQLYNELANKIDKWPFQAAVIDLQKLRFTDVRNRLIQQKSLFTSITLSTNDIQSFFRHPDKWVQQHQLRLSSFNHETLGLVILRLAMSHPHQAAELLLKHTNGVSKELRDVIWAQIGYQFALQGNTEGNDWYKQISSPIEEIALLVTPETEAEWSVRIALLAQDWRSVSQRISLLSSDLQNKEVWRYWKARALIELGQSQEATTLLSAKANPLSFYGKLTLELLKQSSNKLVPLDVPRIQLSQEKRKQFDTNPSLIKAQQFYQLEMFFMGHREWNWAMRGYTDEDYQQLAEYAREHALLHRMINTSQRSQVIQPDYLFPQPHSTQFSTITNAQAVPLSWVYGVIRQESRFMPSVTSTAGAQGLMQIMPSTAKWLAKKLDLKGFRTANLHELDINVQMGSAYLGLLKSDLDNSFVLATAAYNAGPRRARLWRSRLNHATEGAIFIENIPFNETRDYVKNVMANTHTYHALEGGTLSLTQLIGNVVPNSTLQTDLP